MSAMEEPRESADASAKVAMSRLEADTCRAGQDDLAIEAPLQIAVNGRPFVVTMRSPGHDAELAHGLLFSESVIRDPRARLGFASDTPRRGQPPRSIDVAVDPQSVRWPAGGRNLLANTSCGLCGKTRAEDAVFTGAPVRRSAQLPVSLIAPMQARMRERQVLFERCGGTHAAAAFSSEGDLLQIFEDIGRHNAVDKVIGGLLHDDSVERAVALTVSGRVSYEIVGKAAAAGIQVLIAVSAPSTLAVELARERGMTLLAFCREDRFTVYTHPAALIGLAPADVARRS